MSTNEERLVKVAKRFCDNSFATEDFENEKYIKDAVNFALGIYIMMPRQDEIKSLTGDGNNLYVARYNPFMLLVAKSAVAANFGYMDYMGKRLTFIITDNMFRSMDVEAQKAIIAHELGHTMSNHSATHNIRTLKKENQADTYAASIVGVDSMIATLSKIGGDFISRIELKIRIHMLKKQADK